MEGHVDVETRKAHIRGSEIKAIRALRTALVVLHDSIDDLSIVSSLSPISPAELQEARAASWSVLESLLVSAAKDVSALARDPVLGEACLAHDIKKCEELLRADRERESKRLKDKFARKFQWNGQGQAEGV
jgi:hypothetical protein